MSSVEKKRFNEQLSTYMNNRQDREAALMLNQELAKSCCNFKVLLTFAAKHGLPKTARRLIQLGAPVDCLAQGGKTSLMVAIQKGHVKTAKELLEGGASIDLVDARGENTLRMVLQMTRAKLALGLPFSDTVADAFQILHAFFQGMKHRISSVEEFVEKLLNAGFSLFHIAFSNNVKMLQCMLDRGVDIHSGCRCRVPHRDAVVGNLTGLHGAAQVSNLRMATCLTEKGANINALDGDGRSSLFIAASRCDKAMLVFLLEQGADPNAADSRKAWYTPLFALFSYWNFLETEKQADDCLELLLQHGATIRSSNNNLYSIWDYAIRSSRNNGANYLLAHAAMLDGLGNSEAITDVRTCRKYANSAVKIEEYYECCRKILVEKMFEKWSLLALLATSEQRMRVLVRNKSFVSEIEKVCSERKLSESCLYYHKTLKKRVSDASETLKFEDKAIRVVTELFNSNYNLCYNFAKEIISYLNKRELVHLCAVFK